MSGCLFCRIAAGEIPAEIVFQNERLLAFRDIGPQAPEHILLIPRQHIVNLDDARPEQVPLLGELLLTAAQIARALGIAGSGYRTVFNCNAQGGQTVYHLHLHLLGGRPMGWPPG